MFDRFQNYGVTGNNMFTDHEQLIVLVPDKYQPFCRMFYYQLFSMLQGLWVNHTAETELSMKISNLVPSINYSDIYLYWHISGMVRTSYIICRCHNIENLIIATFALKICPPYLTLPWRWSFCNSMNNLSLRFIAPDSTSCFSAIAGP